MVKPKLQTLWRMVTAMRIPLLIPGFLACLVLAHPAGAQSSDCSTGAPGTSARVFNNASASSSEWPGITALILKDRFSGSEYFWCGGNVIAKNWAVTAAHCVQPLKRDASGKFQR